MEGKREERMVGRKNRGREAGRKGSKRRGEEEREGGREEG